MTRVASASTAVRSLAGLAIAALMLAGCSSSGGTAAEETSQGAAEQSQAATTEPLPLLEGPIGSTSASGSAAAGFEERVIAAGLDEGTAFFLAQTRSTIDVIDGHTFAVHHDFPNGAAGEATYHLFAPTTMSASDPPVFTHQAEGTEYRYRMTYAVDTTPMPADMRAQIVNGLPDVAPASTTVSTTTPIVQLLAVAQRRTVVTADDTGSAHTVGVVIDGVISQGQESALDAFVEAGKDRGLTKTAGSWDAYKSGKKVWEALDANEIIAKALADLDALEKCAKNPTAGVTQQEYAKNPAAQEAALKAVAQARFEIKASTAVLFTSLIANAGSALAAEAPWLGFIVSPAVNYTKDSQMAAIESYVKNAEASVVPCRPKAYTISGRIPSVPAGIVVTGKLCALDREFVAMMDGDYVGRLSFTPADEASGSVAFTGKVGNAPLSVKGHGDYTVALADDGASGTLDVPFTSTIKIPKPGRDQTRTNPVHLTLTETSPCPDVN